MITGLTVREGEALAELRICSQFGLA